VSITTVRLNAETSSLNVKLDIILAKASTAGMDITCATLGINYHCVEPSSFTYSFRLYFISLYFILFYFILLYFILLYLGSPLSLVIG
jgi:hypothetical protein